MIILIGLCCQRFLESLTWVEVLVLDCLKIIQAMLIYVIHITSTCKLYINAPITSILGHSVFKFITILCMYIINP